MCGLMPSDSGYDLTLYPNLARYRTPQRDINDNTHNTTYYPATENNNNDNNNNISFITKQAIMYMFPNIL
jgi:hypothetical protein